jgi:uncharacterized lipoprotein YddW (UPF0748 family)
MGYFMKGRNVVAWIILGIFFAAMTSCSGRQEEIGQIGDAIIGVKIYDYEKNYQDLFAEWLSLGINTALVSVSLLSDDEFRDLAAKSGIRLFVIVPVFYDPEELQKNPDLYAITDKGERAVEEWVNFICPTREDYKKRKIEQIKSIIREYNPDGISIDFIRYFVYWEKIYPDRDLNSIVQTCFDSSCLDKFKKEAKIVIPGELSTIPETATWILDNHLEDWTEWKCRVITDTVKEIAEDIKKTDPAVLVNIHTVPWREGDFGGAIKIVAGQDLAAMQNYADFFSPMCYSHMLKREPSWIHSVVQDVHKQTNGRVIPSIQVSKAYLEKKFPAEGFRDALVEALKYPSAGVIFWSWEALAKDQEKKKAVIDVLDKMASWGGKEK